MAMYMRGLPQWYIRRQNNILKMAPMKKKNNIVFKTKNGAKNKAAPIKAPPITDLMIPLFMLIYFLLYYTEEDEQLWILLYEIFNFNIP